MKLKRHIHIVKVGGPYWDVPVGRKDSKAASYELATSNIPTPEEGLISIISKFHNQGLSVEDMVALSGKINPLNQVKPGLIIDIVVDRIIVT